MPPPEVKPMYKEQNHSIVDRNLFKFSHPSMKFTTKPQVHTYYNKDKYQNTALVIKSAMNCQKLTANILELTIIAVLWQ